MGKKLTLDYVKKHIESFKEYKLLSTEYNGAHEKLEILHIPCGTIYSVTWANFKNHNNRCPECDPSKKLTLEYIENYINSVEDYKLMSTEYKGSKEILYVKHIKCGKIYPVTWSIFKSGSRCPDCPSNKFTLEYVKNYIDSVKDYKLMSTEYINALKHLQVKHTKCGTIYLVTFHNFKNHNRRCPNCQNKLTLEYVKKYINSVPEYLLISTKYINSYTELQVKHITCGTIFPVTFNSFKSSKSRCPKCARKLTFKYVKKYIDSVIEYEIMSTEYIGCFEPLQIKHTKCGNIFTVSWSSFYSTKSRCPKCHPNYSKISQELFQIIYKCLPSSLEIYFAEFNHEYKVVTKRSWRFLDFYIPSLNKCIEFDGTYWHQSKLEDQIRENEIKKIISNIQFLRIDEQDYRDNPEKEIQKCLNYIRN